MAGTGAGGYNGDNIPATSARLSAPSAVALDSAGNIFILDRENNRVRKVDAASGRILTVAGTGAIGGFNGDGIEATAATLDSANGLATDEAGNFYIVDTNSQRIRKVTVTTGIINTVAGSGWNLNGWTFGGDGGPAMSAILYNPKSAAIDAVGNLYIADTENCRIRKVSAATGIITTVAGTGSPFSNLGDNIAARRATLYGPTGVAADTRGNVFIADSLNNRIRVVSSSGVITTVAGGGFNADGIGDNLAATNATLSEPWNVAVDQFGNLFIADTRNNRIRKVNAATGIITTFAGNGMGGYGGDNGPATSAMLYRPAGLALAPAGDLYVADTLNNRIRKIASGTGTITTVAGNANAGYNGDNISATSASLAGPYGVAVDGSGNLYIADSYNNRVRKVAAATGMITTVANGLRGLSLPAPLMRALPSGPSGLSLDSAGNLNFSDAGVVRRIAVDTGVVTTVVSGGAADVAGVSISPWLSAPMGIGSDASGALFIADALSNRILKVPSPASLATTNYQGLWWNSPAGSESGWGINFAHQGDIIFATWFTYDAAGKPRWMTMTAHRTGADFDGTLYMPRGPAFNAVPFNPAAIVPNATGTGKITFSGDDSATFSYTIDGVTQSKEITRQVFGALPVCRFGAQQNLALATNYQDIWWAAPAGFEAGWGVNFTHQGDIIFATWFTYDLDGTPMWLSAIANKTGSGTYTGSVVKSTGPAFNSTPFLRTSVTSAVVGTLALTFTDGNSALFAYTVNGVTQSKQITRQVFIGPGTVCG